MDYRVERDALGEVKVPADKYWGAQTQRAVMNFRIGQERMPVEVIRAFAIIKKAAAIANNRLGVLEDDIRDVICQVADEIIEGKLDDHFPVSVWQTGSGTATNMNVNEVISNRANEILGYPLGSKEPVHPNDHVNKSQSSNDTMPTAMSVSATVMILRELLPELRKLKEAFVVKSELFMDIIKVGRTHLQDAVPITLGQVFSGYVAQIEHGIRVVEVALSHLKELAIGGTAVGTGLNAPEGFDAIAVEEISKMTGIDFVPAGNKFEAIAAHDAVSEMSGALKTVANALNKIANDIRILSSGPRCGIGEIQIPANEPGSSIMPGKVNPTQCEALTQICCQVIGNDVAINMGASGLGLELNLYKPLLIYNLLQSVRLLTDGCKSFRKHLVEGIQPNVRKIKEYLDRDLMLVTPLVRKVGYDKASEIARIAEEKDITLREAAIFSGYLSAEEFDRIVDPKNMISPYKASQ